MVAVATVLLAVGGVCAAPANAVLDRIFVEEYQVKGARNLSRAEIEEAVYPFLGPSRSKDDVEQARLALENKYQDKGYQAVSVRIPDQPWQDGVIILEVNENPVGRLRVQGARYFLPSRIKSMAPAVGEGKVLEFGEVNREILALNQHADRRVMPSLRAGGTPGTVDVDLRVEDKLPLHGNLELNNRRSANTTALRLNGLLSYDNLWQLGHSVGGSFQVSPGNFDEVSVASGFYSAPVAAVSGMSVRLQGTKQDSAVATVGDLAVAGRGETIGSQLSMSLPGGSGFLQSLSFSFDYKHNEQDIGAGSNATLTGYTYFPLGVTYTAAWMGKGDFTQLSLGPTFSFRGLGSGTFPFDKSRTGADGNFIYVRADLSHTRQLSDDGYEFYGQLQGQVSSKPLVSGEQFGGGGLGTVRGYLEGEVFGDNAVTGRLELRSGSLFAESGKQAEWRMYFFAEGGGVFLLEPLPEQKAEFGLASIGFGSRLQLWKHVHGSFDFGVPLIKQSTTEAHSPRLVFRLWVQM